MANPEELVKLAREAFEAFDSGELDRAVSLYQECLRLLGPDDPEYEPALHMLGFAWAQQGEFEEARRCYAELLARSQAEGDPGRESVALHQLGMVERLAGHFEAADRFFHAELGLIEQHMDQDRVRRAANLFERGQIEYLRGHLAQARELMNQAWHHANQSGDPMTKGCVLRGMGQIARAVGQESEAVHCFESSAACFDKAGDQTAASEVRRMLR